MRTLFTSFLLLLFYVATFGATLPTVPLQLYVGEGATNYVRASNPTAHDIAYPDAQSCNELGVCTPVKGAVIPAGKSVWFGPFVPPNGKIVGAIDFPVADPALYVESATITGSGALYFHGPLTPRTSATWPGTLTAAGPYNGWIIIIAATKATVISYNGARTELQRNEGILLAPPADGSASFVSQLGGEFYATGGVNFQRNGSQAVVDPF